MATKQKPKPKNQTPQRVKSAAPSISKAKPPAAVFTSTGFWLMKSEPETFSIDDFERERTTLWTGVRNYQARNFMMHSMRPGDQILFYHSNAEPSAIMGIGEVISSNHPDPTAWDADNEYYDPKASPDHPIWFCAKVAFKAHLRNPLTLAELKQHPDLAKMALLQKGQRLSVQPVSKSEFNLILKLAGGLK